MLMVPGATGSAYSFQRVREHLAAHYTVVTYDRRGFSRSQLDGPQDYDRRLETDADDVRRLIEHLGDKLRPSSAAVSEELSSWKSSFATLPWFARSFRTSRQP